MKAQTHNPAFEAAPTALEVQAARWSERMRDPEQADGVRAEFEAWRSRSPAHAHAFERAQAAHALAAGLSDASRLQPLREEARARAQRRVRHRRSVLAIAASLLLVAGAGWLFARQAMPGASLAMPALFTGTERYQTGVGQRTVVRLDDGSVITLNTDSRLRVRYSPARREVVLERGQAMFQVAKDRSRPFVVSAGDRHVTALGTRFDVLLSPRALEVTLLEGRVVVTGRDVAADAERARSTELVPGQQFVETAQSPPQVRLTDVGRVASWLDGQLVFRDERLGDAIAQMNRYSRRKIVLGDRQLASLRLSGAFNSGDVDGFVAALTDYFPVEREARHGDAVVLRMRVQAANDRSQPGRR